MFDGERVLVTGGTGSLGQRLVHRLLTGDAGRPSKVVIFSRDEAKQHLMRLQYLRRGVATDEVIYREWEDVLTFRIGDVRDYSSVVAAVREVDIVINAAALKQVPTCEYFPNEAVMTNIQGALNIVRAIRDTSTNVHTVAGISTDKACKPVNVMGMTKALQERVFVKANLECPNTRFVVVRYGNVIASRGSVIPLFQDQIRTGGPVTITRDDMTRFLLTLDRAVDTVFAAISSGKAGETYVPKAPAARVKDVAAELIGDRQIPLVITGIRPGEKIHEIMVSEEECYRTIDREDYYVILPLLPELQSEPLAPALDDEYSSRAITLEGEALGAALTDYLQSPVAEVYA